jgi:DeoR/GlpR family transcriptional regulator of sugar metabolism
MVERSKEVIAIVDASKWGQVAFATFATLDQLDRVISNNPAPQEMLATLTDRGIRVTTV